MFEIYKEVISSLENSIQDNVIKKDSIQKCKELLQKITELKKQSIGYKEIITSLKLYSACVTCSIIINKSIERLDEGIKKCQNPVAAAEVLPIMESVIELSQSVEESLKGKKTSIIIDKIRRNTFELQEIAEERGWVANLDKKIEGISQPNKKNFVTKVSIEMGN